MDGSDNFWEHEDALDEVIYENHAKDTQVRLTVSEFRGNYYIGLRKWVIDIDDSWMPTKQGFTFPYNIDTTSSMFRALTKILSRAEVLHEVLKEVDFKPDQK